MEQILMRLDRIGMASVCPCRHGCHRRWD